MAGGTLSGFWLDGAPVSLTGWAVDGSTGFRRLAKINQQHTAL